MSRTTLLVDLDGTLTDNFAGISQSIRHALARLGADPPADADLRTCVGPPLRASFARLLATGDRARVEHAIELYRERYATLGWAENVVYDGIAELLDALAADGHRLFLCTSKPQPFAERIVQRFDLAPRFSGIYGADLGGALDDKAALVAHLIAREGLGGSECVMIGDREHDVRAAKANGAAAIGVLWGYGSLAELKAAGADTIVGTPAEVPRAVAALARS
jgi:phosphoglycolate phosphatase